MNDQKRNRLYVISLGFEYLDGKQGKIKTYSFEFLGKQEEKIEEQSELADDEPPASVVDGVSPRAPKRSSGKVLEALISTKILDNKNNLYEIRFSMAKKYEKKIKGYSWHLTGKPEIPKSDQINSAGGPEYIHRLDAGVYYLTVLPVFRKGSLNRKVSYSYLRVLVPEKYFWEKNPLAYGFVLLGLFVALLIKWQYSRIMFYFNAFFRNNLGWGS